MNKNYKCSGCNLCAAKCPKKCIKMVENNEGFLYPKIDKSKCINCKMCEKICPFNFPNKSYNNNLQRFYAAQNKNVKTLSKCASGGAFTALATTFINNGGTVYGICETEIGKAEFIKIEITKDLIKLSGSKYFQCNLTDKILKDIDLELKNNKVLFCGTPCQVACVKKYVKPTNLNNLLTIDIICQGTPSYLSTNLYRKEIEKKEKSKIKKHIFRSKDKYIEKNYLTKYVFENKKVKYYIGEEDNYICSFQRNILLRESCYKCPFCNEKRVGDITLGDIWNKNILVNTKIIYEKGVSVIVGNTSKGTEWINKCQDIHLIEISKEDAISKNIPFHHPVKRPLSRNISYTILKTFGSTYINYICCPKYLIKKILLRKKKIK